MKNLIANFGGVSPKLLIAAAAGVVLVGGATAWWLMGGTPGLVGERGGSPKAVTPEQALDGLTVEAPSLDLSVSPVGELGLSGFDLGSGMAAPTFGSVAVNDDFGYGGKVSLTTPTVNLTAPTSVNVKAPTQASAPAAPPADSSSGGSGSAPAVNAGTCAQFSGVPSCSYVPDPSGQALCTQCRAAGF